MSGRKIATVIGMGKSTVNEWVAAKVRAKENYFEAPKDRVRATQLKAVMAKAEEVTIATDANGDMRISGTVGGMVKTVDEVWGMFGIDRDRWEITKLTCKPYTTNMVIDDKPHSHQAYSLKVELKPRHDVAERIDSLDALLERMKGLAPSPAIK